jgi:hypothetical protein
VRTNSLFIIAAAAFALLFSCSDGKDVQLLQREQLFTMGYGVLEDQLNLFNLEGSAPALKTRLAMRDGIFFIANGNAGKVISLSSFGDLLSMVYNPDKNPAPVVLKRAEPGEQAQGRLARPYPFTAPGEVAIDSRRTIFVEERVPEERRSYDEASQSSLEYVVLRFSREGEYMDFLGQEGVGGTPFPLISGIYLSPNDECVVVALSGDGWTAYWFDPRGILLSTVSIRRDNLPRPEEDAQLFPSMDGITLSPDGQNLLLKIDYYRDVVDQDTKARTGIEFSSSWAWLLSRSSGVYLERYELPGFESLVPAKGNAKPIARSWDLAGTALNAVFLSSVDDDGATYFGVYDLASKSLSRFSIIIEPDELMYKSFYLSSDGILSALLASRYEARVVWWRFDRVLGVLRP